MKGQSKQGNQNVGYKLYPEMVLPAGHVPVYLFGEGGNGAINPIPTKNPGRHYDYRAKTRSNLFATSQYLSVSTFKKCRGRRTQTIDNVDRTYANFLDLDGPVSSQWEIRQRCKDLELPDPTFIIKTSHSRFHVLWYLRVPVNTENPKEVRTWERNQVMLHFAFADLGSDSSVIHDRCRFLRNPYAMGLENRKYCDERGVSKEVVETEFFTGKPINSMLELYTPLCDAGYRKFLRLRDRSEDVNMQVRAYQIISYLKSHPLVEATQEELARVTDLPLSTLKLLLKWMKRNKTLKTKVVGRWSERHTVYSLANSPATSNLKSYKIKHTGCSKDLFLSKNQDYTAPDRVEVSEPPPYALFLDVCNQTKLIRGRRNHGAYSVGVALKAGTGGGTTLEVALERISGFIRLNACVDFRETEILKAIRSGWNAKKGFDFKPHTYTWLGFREAAQ